MTTVITRLFANKEVADRVSTTLYWEGLPNNQLSVLVADAGESAEALTARLTKAQVPEGSAPVYAGRLAEGGALLVARATYKPLGAAQIVREVTVRAGAIPVDGVEDDVYVPDGPDHAPSVLKDHPRFFTLPIEPEVPVGPITAQLGMRMLSSRRKRVSVFRGGRYMSRAFWPMKLVSKGRKANSAMSGTRHMSRLFWPMPLLKSRPARRKVIPGGGHPFSRALGWPTISSKTR